MTDDTIVRVSQEQDTPVAAEQHRVYGYRYAYSRSADSQAHLDKGQDYLTFHENGKRLIFALCDGVSQSFYGDLAAHLLGDALVYWLWKRTPTLVETLQKDLEAFVDSLVEPASKQVETYPIPSDLAPMIYQVLEQKRAVGSESTFVAGLFDFAAGQLFLAWMGDSRLRLWGKDGEITGRLGDAFHTQERWSTRRGRIGDLHTLSMPLGELRYLIAYSDGLAKLDKVMARHFRDASIDSIIEDALLQPESDDTSFFEVWSGGQRPVEHPPLSASPDVKLDVEEGRARVRWRPVAGAAFYEVRLDDGQLFTVYSPGRSLEFPKDTLKVGARTLRLRAWDDEPGKWSAELPVPQELLQPAAPPPQVIPVSPPRPQPAAPTPVPFPAPIAPPPVHPRPTPPSPSHVHAQTPWFRYVFGGLTALLTCCLVVTLLLWPGSPLPAMFFPSPTLVPVPTKIPPTPISLPTIIHDATFTAAPPESSALPEITPTPILSTATSYLIETPVFTLQLCPKWSDVDVLESPLNWKQIATLSKDTCLYFDAWMDAPENLDWFRISPEQEEYLELAGKWIMGNRLKLPEDESWRTSLLQIIPTPIPSPTLTPSQIPSPSVMPPSIP